jgi:hypothetical protein
MIPMEINKIYNENGLHTMQRMPDNYIDLTVTSPPYDNLRVYNGFKFPFRHIARQLYRVTKWGGVVVWVVADATINGSETGTSFSQALFFKEVGFRLHDTMIYAKENPIPLTHNRYEQQFEYKFVFSKGKPKTFNPLKERCLTNGHYNHRRNTVIKQLCFSHNTDPILKIHFVSIIEANAYHRGRGDLFTPEQIVDDYIKHHQYYEACRMEFEAWRQDLNRKNNRLLKAIKSTKGRTFYKYLLEILSDVDYSHELFEIVDKPTGEYQAEKYGYTIKGYWVDQWAVGMEGDNWEGFIYVELKQGKYFKVKFCM